MTEDKPSKRPSSLPLIAMILVYMPALAAAAAYFFMGLLFGSEAYRDRGIPLIEWVVMTGPLVVIGAMLAATIILWEKGNRLIPYAMLTVLLIGLLALLPTLMGYLA